MNKGHSILVKTRSAFLLFTPFSMLFCIHSVKRPLTQMIDQSQYLP